MSLLLRHTELKSRLEGVTNLCSLMFVSPGNAIAKLGQSWYHWPRSNSPGETRSPTQKLLSRFPSPRDEARMQRDFS